MSNPMFKCPNCGRKSHILEQRVQIRQTYVDGIDSRKLVYGRSTLESNDRSYLWCSKCMNIFTEDELRKVNK